MRNFTIFASLTLATGLGAQTVTLETETDVAVFADNSRNQGLGSAVKGTMIRAGSPLRLTAGGRGATASATASLGSRGGVIGAAFSSSAGVDRAVTNGSAGTAATTDPNNIRQAPHSFLLTLTNIRTRSLALVLATRNAGRAQASVKVDVGADGTIEFMRSADNNSYRQNLAVSGATIKVRVTIEGDVSAGQGYAMNLTLTSDSNAGGACQFTRLGQPCPQTVLFGRDQPTRTEHVLGLQIAGAFPGKPVLLVLGAMTANIQLPGSRCRLLTAPLIVTALSADAQGRIQNTLRFPLASMGTGYLQAIPLDTTRGRIVASNGLRVVCR